ncbi:MAG: four helix bundle protein [Muribaculaceae bacterium]|nr:four helix bundle protein [Muribaculaceae bacterium]
MSGRPDNTILNKSFKFAVRIVKLYKFLTTKQKEYVMSKQILRSGTSIGANVHEAVEGFSIKDFQFKLNIALKEARETEYWLKLLHETEYISDLQYSNINNDCTEILKLLVSILKTLELKNNIEQENKDDQASDNEREDDGDRKDS